MKIKQTSRLTQLVTRACLVIVIAFSVVGLVGVGGDSASAAANYCRNKYPAPLGGSASAAEHMSEQRGACQTGYDTQKCNTIVKGSYNSKAALKEICQKGVAQSERDGVEPVPEEDPEGGDSTPPPSSGSTEPGTCPDRVLTFPTWYRGLQNADCNIESPGSGESAVSDFIWTIVLNVIEIALQLVGYLAVGFIIYGGFKYITGAGSPDKITAGRKIILNAVIGLIISIFSIAIVNLVVRGFE